ncbi:MAG TPA: hypothetical protein PLX69_10925 [Leptospiraceae bacterium]|nr:hypothetical protein [Leptospiraceae bacterium]HRG75061.1 hypothetical protein [Leptospiraceae bacterium]
MFLVNLLIPYIEIIDGSTVKASLGVIAERLLFISRFAYPIG